MKNAPKNNPPAPEKKGPFFLPFSNESITVDRTGAKKLARIACEMGMKHSSPVESDKQYAARLVAFICGYIATQCDNRDEQMWLFTEFLKMVYGWLNKGCSEYEAPHHWDVFSENGVDTGEIVKADYLGNI